jgi:hypothetical protein
MYLKNKRKRLFFGILFMVTILTVMIHFYIIEQTMKNNIQIYKPNKGKTLNKHIRIEFK